MFCDPRHVNKFDEVLSVGTSDGEHIADLKQPLQSRTGVMVWQMYFKVILVWDLTFTKAKLKWLIAMLFVWDFAF